MEKTRVKKSRDTVPLNKTYIVNTDLAVLPDELNPDKPKKGLMYLTVKIWGKGFFKRS
jgi:hypothetical protein